VVISEQTKHLLPGTLRAPGTAATPPKLPEGVPSRPAFPQLSSQLSKSPLESGAQQASYQAAAAQAPTEPNALPIAATANAAPLETMRTTSIPLPRDFQIPRAAAPPVDAYMPNVKHIVPAAQLPAAQTIVVPQINPAAAGAVPQGATQQQVVPGQRALGSIQAARFAAAAQRQAQPVSAGVYNPIYGPPASQQPASVTGHLPGPYTMQPPAIAQPQAQLAPQAGNGVEHAIYHVGQQTPQQPPAQTAQQVPPQFAGGIPAVVTPQTAAQMIQIPATGTATVTYQ
jgi:hypothetical protein